MLIIDWSSDVCSSDLRVVGRCKLGRFGHRQSAVAYVQIDGRVDLRIGEFHQHVVAADAKLRRAMGDKGRDVERTDANQLHIGPVGGKTQSAGRFIAERGFGLAAGCRKQRSEEHTSELQSLIRISYAVFCLKQTTTTYSNAK